MKKPEAYVKLFQLREYGEDVESQLIATSTGEEEVAENIVSFIEDKLSKYSSKESDNSSNEVFSDLEDKSEDKSEPSDSEVTDKVGESEGALTNYNDSDKLAEFLGILKKKKLYNTISENYLADNSDYLGVLVALSSFMTHLLIEVRDHDLSIVKVLSSYLNYEEVLQVLLDSLYDIETQESLSEEVESKLEEVVRNLKKLFDSHKD